MLALHTNGLITAAGVLSAGVASTALATARLRSLRPSSAEVIAIIAVALTLATSLLILLGIINANQRPHGRDGASSLQPAIQAGPAARSAAQRQAESLRVDPSQHFLGLRLNTYVAAALTLAGAAWFTRTQHQRPRDRRGPGAPGITDASPAVDGARRGAHEMAGLRRRVRTLGPANTGQ